MLPSVTAEVAASTVNRKLAAVSAFYAHQARSGAEVGDLLAVWRTGGRGGWKPFLHHVSKDKPYRGRAIALKAPKKLPRILTVAEMQAVLDACTRLRDRFFFAVLHETGCRAGEVLGLRHEDIAAAEREVSIVARENANGARAKSGGRTVPVGPELIRLYADYLHEEYGGIDSDHVFVNIWAEPKGHAWTYQAVYDLVLRLRARTGIAFDPHWFRHSAATRWLRDGVPIEVVSTLLGSLLGNRDVFGLRAPDGGGRAGGAGEGGLVHREGSAVVTGGWITQADRSRWQQRAAARAGRHPGRAPGAAGDRVDRHRVRRGTVRPGPRARRGQARAVRGNGGGRWGWTRPPRPRPRAGRLFTCTPAVSAAASRSASPRPSSTMRETAGERPGSRRRRAAPGPGRAAGKADGRGAPGVPGRRPGVRSR